VEIQSTNKINLNAWNTLIITRDGIDGTINLNGVSTTGSAPAGLSDLNVDQGLYIGGANKQIPKR